MKLYIVSPLALAVMAIACGPPAMPPEAPAAPSPSTPATEAAPEVAITPSVSDRDALRAIAFRLAGLASDEDAGETWARHAELMDEIWVQVEDRHLAPMRTWAEAELDLADPEAPLYYPFGGPDLASALQFFPAASSYVLVGLEPPGRIPDLEGLAAGDLAGELERLRSGLKNLAEAGYFVTKRMETDFAATSLEGLLPVLYIFLARAGFTPASVEFVHLDAEGVPMPMSNATDRTATAVRINATRHWRAGEAGDRSGQATRTLYYFSRDLSNPGLASAPNFVAFLRRLGAFNTYMKSASYLLHMDDFTAHKDFLVAHAGTVLQDDSGVPLRDLPQESWQLRTFGTYTQTLPTYREWFQEDLKAVYEQSGIQPLPFAIGYHSKIGGSCLIWAERRAE